MVRGPQGPIDDVILVQELVRGSETALESLYDRHAAGVFALAYRLTSDRGIAEEVVQDTFLRLWNRAESFDASKGSLAAWLYAVAHNRSIDRLRAARRRPDLLAPGSPDGSGADPAEAIDRLLSYGSGAVVIGGAVPMPGPEDVATAAARSDAIRLALAALPDEEQTVILLAYQAELSQVEIAERLGWPLGTVKTRTRRALRRLREALGAEYMPDREFEAVPVPAGEDR